MVSPFTRREALHVVVRLEQGISPEQQVRIRAASPEAEVVFVRGEDELAAALPDAHVIGGTLPRQLFPLARRVRWIHNFAAGAEPLLYSELRDANVMLTTSKGAHATPISEHCLMLMLMFAHRMPEFGRQQHEGRWERVFINELSGKTVAIIGLGNIGRELARKCQVGFGMRVVGTARTLRETAHVDRLYAAAELHAMLAESDFVCMLLPGTPETRGIIGEAELRAMKSTAYLVNCGRGVHVVASALEQALREGWIAGAALDATDPEPLPPDSPLRQMPNVIITPHLAGLTWGTRDRGADRFCANLRHLLRDEPLEGLVDRIAGY